MHSAPSSPVQMPCISGMLDRLTNVVGEARRCFSVGIRVCPPPKACASSPPNAATASAMLLGFSNSKLYIFCPFSWPPIAGLNGQNITRAGAMPQPQIQALLIAFHTRSGVSGISICATFLPPEWSASITAFTTDGGDPIAPASPHPFTPNGLCVQGVWQE